jgi:hypothetical protein
MKSRKPLTLLDLVREANNMWTMVIFAIGLSATPTTNEIGRITGFSSSAECQQKAEELEKTLGIFTTCEKTGR